MKRLVALTLLAIVLLSGAPPVKVSPSASTALGSERDYVLRALVYNSTGVLYATVPEGNNTVEFTVVFWGVEGNFTVALGRSASDLVIEAVTNGSSLYVYVNGKLVSESSVVSRRFEVTVFANFSDNTYRVIYDGALVAEGTYNGSDPTYVVCGVSSPSVGVATVYSVSVLVNGTTYLYENFDDASVSLETLGLGIALVYNISDVTIASVLDTGAGTEYTSYVASLRAVQVSDRVFNVTVAGPVALVFKVADYILKEVAVVVNGTSAAYSEQLNVVPSYKLYNDGVAVLVNGTVEVSVLRADPHFFRFVDYNVFVTYGEPGVSKVLEHPYGTVVNVTFTGEGNVPSKIVYGGEVYSSSVLPFKALKDGGCLTVVLAEYYSEPTLTELYGARLIDALFTRNVLDVNISGFKSSVRLVIKGFRLPKAVYADGVELPVSSEGVGWRYVSYDAIEVEVSGNSTHVVVDYRVVVHGVWWSSSYGGSVKGARISEELGAVLYAYSDRVELYDTLGNLLQSIILGNASIVSFDVSADLRYLVLGLSNGTVSMLVLDQGKYRHLWSIGVDGEPVAVDISEGGEYVVVATSLSKAYLINRIGIVLWTYLWSVGRPSPLIDAKVSDTGIVALAVKHYEVSGGVIVDVDSRLIVIDSLGNVVNETRFEGIIEFIGESSDGSTISVVELLGNYTVHYLIRDLEVAYTATYSKPVLGTYVSRDGRYVAVFGGVGLVLLQWVGDSYINYTLDTHAPVKCFSLAENDTHYGVIALSTGEMYTLLIAPGVEKPFVTQLWLFNASLYSPQSAMALSISSNGTFIAYATSESLYVFGPDASKPATLVVDRYYGAGVYLNGTLIGKSPLTKKLVPGLYQLVLKAGVIVFLNETIMLMPGTIYYVSGGGVAYGILKITTSPSNAQVYINGSFVGWTPLELQLDPATYIVELRYPKHVPYREVVVIKPGEIRTLDVVLQLAPGTLDVYTDPPGADVYVDGVLIGKSPIVGVSVSAGSHNVTVVLEGYRKRSFIVSVEPESRYTLNVALKPYRPRIEVFSEPENAYLYINGSFVAVTPANITLDPGTYVIELVKPGYYRWNTTITLIGQVTITIRARLQPMPVPVRIHVSPVPAYIYINGTLYGNGTYLEVYLEPGIYLVEVIAPEYMPWNKTVVVEAGKPLDLYVTLVPYPANITFVLWKDIRFDGYLTLLVSGLDVNFTTYVVFGPGISNVTLQLPPGTYSVTSLDTTFAVKTLFAAVSGTSLTVVIVPTRVTLSVVLLSGVGDAVYYINGKVVGRGNATVDLSTAMVEPPLASVKNITLVSNFTSVTLLVSYDASTNTIRFVVYPDTSPGYIVVTAYPPESEISVDGEVVGKGAANITLPPGSHTITISAFGYENRTITVFVTPRMRLKLSVKLDPLPVTLKLSSKPTEAYVYVNGEYKGKTPIVLKLPPGKYFVRIVKKGYEPAELIIVLTPGYSLERTIVLERKRLVPYLPVYEPITFFDYLTLVMTFVVFAVLIALLMRFVVRRFFKKEETYKALLEEHLT